VGDVPAGLDKGTKGGCLKIRRNDEEGERFNLDAKQRGEDKLMHGKDDEGE